MKPRTHLATLGAALALAGCASHTHMLASDTTAAFLRGEFTHGNVNRLVLESTTERYEASGFEVRRHSDWIALQKQYRGSDPKHWDRIFAGHDKDHETLSAEVVAQGAKGSRLSCFFAWPAGSAPTGSCVDRMGHAIPVGFN